ncbi:MAG: DUF378 domain-containing protein [Clostridium sp.]
MKFLDSITLILVIIGAINWGLIGFFNYNLVGALFGTGIISTVIYVLVGLSGIYLISFFSKIKYTD